jgi:hypothetical protein
LVTRIGFLHEQDDDAGRTKSSRAGWGAVVLEPLSETASAIVAYALLGVGAGWFPFRFAGFVVAIHPWCSRLTAAASSTADFARSQKLEIACAEVRESLNALADADAWDLGGREVHEVFCADLEVHAAAGRVDRGGDFDVGWHLAAFEGLKELDSIKYLAVLTRLDPLRRHESAYDASGARLEVLLLDRGAAAGTANGGTNEGKKGKRQQGGLHDCARDYENLKTRWP